MRTSRTRQALLYTIWLAIGGLAYRSTAGPSAGVAIRAVPQLAGETKIWVAKIRDVEASGRTVRIENDGSDAVAAQLREYIGPYIPVERIEFIEVSPGHLFALKMKVKHAIDIPYPAEHYIIRVTFSAKVIQGRLLEARTLAKGLPVTVLAFDESARPGIDRLDESFKSTVPSLGKFLGLLPHVVALVYVEDVSGPKVAPQLDGLGVPENARLFKELLGIDDTLLPETILASAK